MEVVHIIPRSNFRVFCYLSTGHIIDYDAKWARDNFKILSDSKEFVRRATIDGGFLAFHIDDVIDKNSLPITLDTDVIFKESKVVNDEFVDKVLNSDN